jgi:CDP-diacylglycerol--serine O-phosphatidyltransferase
MCGVLRLARFNVQKHTADPRSFVGLPIPAAAGQLVTVIAFAPARVTGWVHGLFALILVVALAFLMVSTFRYRSFKGFDLRRRRSYLAVLGIALLFVFIAAHLEYSLLALATLYTLSAPGGYLLGLVWRRRGTPAPPAVATGEAR